MLAHSRLHFSSAIWLPRHMSPFMATLVCLACLVPFTLGGCTPENVKMHTPSVDDPASSLSYETESECGGRVNILLEGEWLSSDLNAFTPAS